MQEQRVYGFGSELGARIPCLCIHSLPGVGEGIV